MLTIGVFAAVGQVTVQALRHYDRLGLLKPDRVDRFTNYRYYSLEQLPRLYRILALKELGLSLEQIGTILDDDVSAEQMRGMLRLRRAQLRETLAEAEQQLKRVEAHIQQIETEGEMPQGDVILKKVEPMRVAGRRIRIPVNEGVILEDLSSCFREVGDYVHGQNAADTGPCVAIWYTPHDQFRDEEAEAAFPIAREIPGTDRITIHDVEGAQVASIMHQGDFRKFQSSVKAVVSWIERNGFTINGPFREVYHKFDRNDLDHVMVEVQFPVAKNK